ncbi:MAG: glycosyltransferase [Aquabacterium sp.]|nr:glycosyltransferase [Ferruginibacter sp.]
MKKRIVHVVPSFGQGGVQTGMLYSLQSLNEVYDYKILVLTKMDEECKAWIKDLPPLLRSYIIDTGATGFFKGWIKGYSILKQLQPDLVISSMWKSVGLTAPFKLLNKSVPMAGFFHTSYTPHPPYFFAMKILSWLQDGAFADSGVTKDYIARVYKIRNAHIIPYLFAFTKNEMPQSFDPAQIRIAYFGIISPVKKVERALEFCRLCKLNGISFIFDIYARGPVAEYNDKIEKLGLKNEVTIKSVVPLSLVTQTMQHYNFLLQLSDHEGMALSVVEAMNCGLVPLVTPVGEIARYSKDGVNALWLTPPFDNNLPQLVNKLQRVIQNPESYAALSASAADTFTHHTKYSEALIEAIAQCLQGK